MVTRITNKQTNKQTNKKEFLILVKIIPFYGDVSLSLVCFDNLDNSKCGCPRVCPPWAHIAWACDEKEGPNRELIDPSMILVLACRVTFPLPHSQFLQKKKTKNKKYFGEFFLHPFESWYVGPKMILKLK